jgi:Spy/CpxP family protein refolding chaperone
MKSKDFWRPGLALLLTAMLLIPGIGQAQAEPAAGHYKLEWEKLVKELNLTPEKAEEFQAIGARYLQTRKDLIEKLKKDESDLEKAVAAPQPDEAKIKELVPVIIAGHNQLFESFKAQRQ